MEIPVKTKISAYNRICQIFLEACESENVEPEECLKALCRFIIPSFPTTSSSVIATPAQPTGNIQLTKEQVEIAKKEARVAKAKRIGQGLTFKDVNLTPQEVKEAKTAYRKKLQGSPPLEEKPVSQPKVPKQKLGSKEEIVDANDKLSGDDSKVPSPSTPSEAKPQKELKKVGVQHSPSGLRRTAKTRLDNCRQAALRHSPVAQVDPTVLHLIAYCNDYNRLSNQWEEYQKTYESSGLLNPLRGLLSPHVLKETITDLESAMSTLVEHSASPGTYILQSLETGASYWSMDKPSEACPNSLKRQLTKEEVRLMSDLVGNSN